MKLKRQSSNPDVIDTRGRSMAVPVGAALGGGGLIALIVTLVLGLVGGGSGFDVGNAINQLPNTQVQQPPPGTNGVPDPDADLKVFVESVLADIQGTWTTEFQQSGKTYTDAQLVLFTGQTNSGCGPADSSVGPFYCPADQRVYLDFDFFRELQSRFSAPGDFAQGYVIAHEIGHHVQKLTGISDRVSQLEQENPDQQNELSVRTELQADCLAGVWGHSAAARGILEPGDLEEGLAAAAAVGDDRLQKQATGRINPDTWTHGSSDQRVHWFRQGFDSGNPNACDTFSGDV